LLLVVVVVMMIGMEWPSDAGQVRVVALP